MGAGSRDIGLRVRTTGCDLCERAIKDRGYLYDLVEAQVLRSDATPLRIAGRGEILLLHLCAQCTAQVQRLMHAIRWWARIIHPFLSWLCLERDRPRSARRSRADGILRHHSGDRSLRGGDSAGQSVGQQYVACRAWGPSRESCGSHEWRSAALHGAIRRSALASDA